MNKEKKILGSLTINDLIEWKKTVTAGAIIGFCGSIYAANQNAIGAFLFGIGLITICMCNLPLFTGRCGSSKLITLLPVLIGNIIGAVIVSFVFHTFADSYIVLGIGCGFLMQIAVVAYKKNLPWITVMCVGAFILSGYKHCIAMLYTTDLNYLNWILALIGNVIGSKLLFYGGVENK